VIHQTEVAERPIIALSSRRVIAEYDGRCEQVDGSNAAYSRAVLAAGGVPFILPYGVDVTVADRLLAGAHALLLTGGEDVIGACPAQSADRGEHEDPVRDLTDRALLCAARSQGMPILGVCRGMQLLADASHGTLVRVEGHAPAPGSVASSHEVEVESGSRLEALLGSMLGDVLSLHTFAVADPGLLRVVARSRADGVIEAIMGTDPERFELGVQWHPELDRGPFGAPIIRLLVDAARDYLDRAERPALRLQLAGRSDRI